jgi:hypothetical protein
LYLMGMPFLRRRKSSLIDGVGDDARDLSAHLARFLGTDPGGRGPGRCGPVRPRAVRGRAPFRRVDDPLSPEGQWWRGADRAGAGDGGGPFGAG